MTNLRRDIKKGNTLIFEIKYKKRKQTVWEEKERYYLRVCERERKKEIIIFQTNSTHRSRNKERTKKQIKK